MTFPVAERRLRVLFVGFQDQDNLGLRYLMAAASQAGHEVGIETFSSDPRQLVQRVQEWRPEVIGLSLIFQYMTPRFGAVVEALRSAGTTAHITLGGHYPSFDPAAVLNGIPGADSVVRFEGEATLVELLDCLAAGREWRGIQGIAHRLDDGAVKTNPLRPQVMDLDTLPCPVRDDIRYEQADQATAAILGSRGCPWNCEFCSIRPFYEAQEGQLRRLRRPAAVLDEMRALYHERGVALFLFQDDDFLATGSRARRWAGELSDLIAESDIGGRIAFKISCRSDELRPDIIERMKRGGLTHVYMGVESGDEEGLAHMRKQMKPQAHIDAGNMLREAELSFDFGFMLLEPRSDMRITRSNVDFLDRFVGDGWTVASFCRMLPYSGTPVERKLLQEGRLKGSAFEPDYSFLDPRLDLLYAWVLQTFHTRNFTSEGLCHILRALNFEARLQSPATRWMQPEEARWLQHVTALANGSAITVLRAALDRIEATPLDELSLDDPFLTHLTDMERREEERLTAMVSRFFTAPDRQARRSARRRAHDHQLLGGFDRSWTMAQSDWEARGIGVR